MDFLVLSENVIPIMLLRVSSPDIWRVVFNNTSELRHLDVKGFAGDTFLV